MLRIDSAPKRAPTATIAICAVLLSATACLAQQVQPSDMPRNAISRAVPLEQGLAQIRERDANRPKASRPRRAGDPELAPVPPSPAPDEPASPVTGPGQRQ